MKRGDEFFAAKSYSKAKIEYLNALRLRPDDPHVLNQLGQSFLQEGEAFAAAELLSRVCQIQPTNYLAAVTLGSIYFIAGELPKATEYAELALKSLPSNTDALVLLANCAGNKEEISALEKRLLASQSANPGSAPLYFALGILAQKVSDQPKAESLYQKAVSLDGNQSRFHLALANSFWAQGKTNNADLSFKSAVQLAPGKSVESLAYAEYLVKTRRSQEGKKLLSDLLVQYPDFFPAINFLTEIALAENDLDIASKLNSDLLAVSRKTMMPWLIGPVLSLRARIFPQPCPTSRNWSNNFPGTPPFNFISLSVKSPVTIPPKPSSLWIGQ